MKSQHFFPKDLKLDYTEWTTMGFMFTAHLQENSESRNQEMTA